MKFSTRVGFALGATMGAFLALGAANADVFDFSFAGGGFYGSGELFADGGGAPGLYNVGGAIGTITDPTYDSGRPSDITGVSGFVLPYPLVVALDDPFSFSTADGNEVGIAYGPSYDGGSYFVSDLASQANPISSISFDVTAVPEPSTWIMMALGFASLGVLGYRARQGEALA